MIETLDSVRQFLAELPAWQQAALLSWVAYVCVRILVGVLRIAALACVLAVFMFILQPGWLH